MFRGGEPSAAAIKVGSMGGKARADSLTAEHRKEIARAAAKKRWVAFYASRRARLEQAR